MTVTSIHGEPSQRDAARKPAHGAVQRKCACGAQSRSGGECEACAAKRLQRRAASADRADPGRQDRHGVVVPRIVDETLRSPGQALDGATRTSMETRFGHDFGRVRVHIDAQAAASARAVNAHAYTVGDDVVFAAGRYAPASDESRRLLAHELAHVVQQRGPGSVADAAGAHEAAAARAEQAFASGAPLPALQPTGPTLARQEAAAPSDAAARASTAELMCDIRTLCQLRFSAPDVVNAERVRRVYRRCRPEVGPVFLDPCLMPDLSARGEPGAGPTPTPTPTPGAGGPTAPPTRTPGAAGGSSGSGLALPSTNVRFSLGPVQFNIDLPASLAVRLPVPFQGAERIVFALNASPRGFSFSATINAVPHVRIIARAGVTTSGTGSAGLTVETTRTVCRAMDEAAARAALQSAGERLRDAITAVQNPPPVAEDASELERTFAPHARLGEVVAAIANVHSAIERVRSRCREVPVASFEFGVRGPLSTPGAEEREGGGSYIGGSATFRF